MIVNINCLFAVVNMVKYCDFSRWSIYINKVLLDKRSKSISDVLQNDTIKKILHLVFKNQTFKELKINKNIVRIIIIHTKI